MKLTYYGTGGAQGLPALFCDCATCRRAWEKGGKNFMTRSQSLLTDEQGKKLLIDFPPDTYDHVLRFGLDLRGISDLLITHAHGDHLHVDDMTNRHGYRVEMPEDNPVMTVYGSDVTGQKLADLLSNPKGRFVFRELKPYETAQVASWECTPLPANHSKELHSLLYVLRRGGASLFYGNDTAYFDAEVWDYLASVPPMTLVSLDCAFTGLDLHFEHMGIGDCLRTADRMMELGCADEKTRFYLNHFAHFSMTYDEIADACRDTRLTPAYDGLTVEF